MRVAEVTPADLPVQLAQAREPAPQPKLTPELLAAYVARQQAIKTFSAFDVPQTGSVTTGMLSAYVDSHANPALAAIDTLEGAAPNPR